MNKLSIDLDLNQLDSPEKVADILQRLSRRILEYSQLDRQLNRDIQFIDYSKPVGTMKVKGFRKDIFEKVKQ